MTSLTDLREVVDVVIGVDTHKDTHTAAVLDARTGAVLDGRDRRAAGQTAPAEGLCFLRADYPQPIAWS